jgi:hypothetical protein
MTEVYRVEIQFVNEKTGEQITVYCHMVGWKIGDKKTILYDPDNPTNFIIESGGNGGFLPIVFVLIVIGAFLLILSARVVYLIRSGKLDPGSRLDNVYA